MKRILVTVGAAAVLVLPVVPAAAAESDGCTLGSPNIVRDVTDCVASLVGDCSFGSPNILQDLSDCLSGILR